MRHLSSCQSKQERLFHCFRSSVEPSNFDQISSYFVHSTRQQPTITASTLTAAAATFKMSTWRSNLRHRILPKYLHASDLHFRDNGHTYTADCSLAHQQSPHGRQISVTASSSHGQSMLCTSQIPGQTGLASKAHLKAHFTCS